MSILNPLQGTTKLEYYEHENLIKKTDAKNKLTQYRSIVNFNQTIETKYNPKLNQKMIKYLQREITITNDIKTQTKIIKDNNRYPITIHYDKNGVETKIVYPNNLTEEYKFDKNYNLKEVTTAKQRISYQYNANGEIVQKNGIDYQYDNIGRLIRAGAKRFNYDKAGNQLTSKSIIDKITNQISQDEQHRFYYDKRGNLKCKDNTISKRVILYIYNDLNQLINIEINQNRKRVKSIYYEYDAMGRRVKKVEDNTTQYYLYDKQNIIAILDHNKIAIATLVHHDSKIDTPLSIHTIYGKFYYHRDHQGSIVALSDEYGDIVETIQYDEHYGQITKHWKRDDVQTMNPYAYTGREIELPEF